MTILLYDVLQALTIIPAKIKSPALADRWQPPIASSAADVVLNVSSVATPMDSLGIAAHGATTVTIWQGANKQQIAYNGAGLYPIAKLAAQPLHVQVRNAKNQAVPIQRLALGRGLHIGISRMREPGWKSSTEPRQTLSGQAIRGLGGYAFRTLSCEIKYRIDETFLKELDKSYPTQIAQGFPFFLHFSEKNLPFSKLYAQAPLEYIMQNATIWKLYSMKLEFREAF